MSRFVITITPESADADGAASAQTTVRVDTSTGHTRITELTVRAADGGGLAPADLPAVDLELLIRALGAPSVTRALTADNGAEGDAPAGPAGGDVEVVHLATPAEMAEAVEPSEVAAEPTGTGGRAVDGRGVGGRAAGGRQAVKKTARGAAGAETGVRTGRKAAAVKATATKASGAKATATKASGAKASATKAAGTRAAGTRAAGTKAAGTKASEAKATGRGRKAAAAGGRQTRAYRRMPEPAEVLEVYAQTGSITRLAEHFGVPRHTANGWARRLRREGNAIGRS